MEILLTGNTAFLTKEWVESAFPDDHVVTTYINDDLKPDNDMKPVKLDSKQHLAQLNGSYRFERVVYFSEYLIPHSIQEGELDRLRWVLQECRDQDVQLIYLSGPESVLEPASSKSLMAKAAEDLCFHYARTSKIQVKIFCLPYLYAASANGSKSMELLFEQMKSGKVHMDEQPEQPLFTLCTEELSDLILRVFDTWTGEPEKFIVPEAFGLTHSDLGIALQKLQPDLEVEYGNDTVQYYPEDDGVVRKRYGWYQRYSLVDELPTIYKHWSEKQTVKKTPFQKFIDWLRQSTRLLRIIEIIVAWLLVELLVRATNTDAQFQMIDFRLLFVVLVGTLYGLNAGVFGAVLASVSLAWGYMRQGVALTMLFYEPSNWLAFIAYFVVGASCGYVQLRNAETIKFVREENTLLRERIKFIEQLYNDALNGKQNFRRQILGRKDSFGKIYTVTRQLDMLKPQEIYRKTVQVMEDILENHSLSIYHLEKNHAFARLTAASAASPKPLNSIDVENYVDIVRAIEQDGLWVNRSFKEGMPMYAAGVRHNGNIVVLIFLQTANDDQMNLYYQNLFRILCGLVETALVRAFEYESAVQDSWYLPGTCLLRPEYFAEQLSTACGLQEDKMANHIVMRISGNFKNIADMNNRIVHCIRSSDIAGLGSDRSVYLLMNQAVEENLPILLDRLEKNGLHSKVIALDEQLKMISEAKAGEDE